MRVAISALGAVKTMQAGNVAYTPWDASVDGETVNIVDFAHRPIIDRAARLEAVENARRADAFDERVDSEVVRLITEKREELQVEASERIRAFEEQAIESERRAQSAETSRDAAHLEPTALRAETDVLQRVVEVAGVRPEVVEAIRAEVSENSVLPSPSDDSIVVDAEGAFGTIEPQKPIVREERKA